MLSLFPNCRIGVCRARRLLLLSRPRYERESRSTEAKWMEALEAARKASSREGYARGRQEGPPRTRFFLGPHAKPPAPGGFAVNGPRAFRPLSRHGLGATTVVVIRRGSLAFPFVLALMISWAWSSSAGAAVQVGQVQFGAGACAEGASFAQQQATIPYEVSSAGVITQWTHYGRSGGPAGGGRLQIWKQIGPTAPLTGFQLVGRSAVETFTSGQVTSFGTRIPVSSGDLLGIRTTSADTACQAYTGLAGDSTYLEVGADPAPGDNRTLSITGAPPAFKLNVSAVVEPDADSDGFGDESQDGCNGLAGPSGGCPSNQFAFGGVKKNTRKGTAKLAVEVPGPGEVEVEANKKLKGAGKSAKGEGALKLPIKPKGKAKKQLKRKGKTKVRADVTYTPSGGEPRTKAKKVALKKKKKK